jgi:hypothetical protein
MASKRLLKKKVKRMVYEILNECDYVIVSGGKGADSADKLIDEAVTFHNDLTVQIGIANSKKEFRTINETIESKSVDFVKKLNSIS